MFVVTKKAVVALPAAKPLFPSAVSGKSVLLSCKFIAVCEDFSDSHLQIMPRQGYPLNTRLRASPATARQARNDAKEEEISGTTPAFAKASAWQARSSLQFRVIGVFRGLTPLIVCHP